MKAMVLIVEQARHKGNSQDQVELCMYITYLTFPFRSCVYARVEFLLPASADHKRIMQNKEIKMIWRVKNYFLMGIEKFFIATINPFYHLCRLQLRK